MKLAAGLDALEHRYDAFLIDQFGVLMDGAGPYPHAPPALARLMSTGKPVMVLSNSGKRAGPNAERLMRAGFGPVPVLTSGEAAHRLLLRRIGHGLTAGTRVWVHGRDDDRSVVEGLDLGRADLPHEAGLIVIAGSLGERMTLDAYARLLEPAAALGVPCLCTNPDMEMLTPEGRSFGAGRIAALYADLGGPVEWIGKPHPLIYAEAVLALPGMTPGRILCIGDSPEHDVAGGAGAGHATALVRTGLQEGRGVTAIAAQCRAAGAVPTWLLPRFAYLNGG